MHTTFFKSITFICIVASLLLTSSCATVIKGGRETISFSSIPHGAVLEISDKSNMPVARIVTPSVVTLKKGSGFFSGQTYVVNATKEGYMPTGCRIETNLNVGAYVFGNIGLSFVGAGLLGFVLVDPLSGAMWNLTPSNLPITDSGIVQYQKNHVTFILEKENK